MFCVDVDSAAAIAGGRTAAQKYPGVKAAISAAINAVNVTRISTEEGIAAICRTLFMGKKFSFAYQGEDNEGRLRFNTFAPTPHYWAPR